VQPVEHFGLNVVVRDGCVSFKLWRRLAKQLLVLANVGGVHFPSVKVAGHALSISLRINV
jgi:hypothetical protein